MNVDTNFIYAYLDGELDSNQFDQLEKWIQTDINNARVFSLIAADDYRIRSILKRKQIQAFQDLNVQIHTEHRDDKTVDFRYSSVLAEALDEEQLARTEREAAAALERQQSELRDAERRESMRMLMGLGKPDTRPPTCHYVIPKPLFYGSIAAVIAIVAAIFWPMVDSLRSNDVTNRIEAEGPVEDSPVATLITSSLAVWNGDRDPKGDNVDLFAGHYVLRDGLAKIRFGNGAEVIVEAPAEFELIGHSEMGLTSGRLVGFCPRGSEGFAVVTPNARIIDLGTEFGVHRDEQGELEAHVFDGEVQVTTTSNGSPRETRLLQQNHGCRVDVTGTKVDAIPIEPTDFVLNKEFDVNVKAANGSAYYQWLAHSMRIRRDRDVVVYYTFEKGATHADPLENVAFATAGQLDGVLGDNARNQNDTEPQWTSGRFNQKRALRFNPRLDQVVTVPIDRAIDATDQLTLAAWVQWRVGSHETGIILNHVSPGRVGVHLGLLGPRESVVGQRRTVQYGAGAAQKLNDPTVYVHSDVAVPLDDQWHLVAMTRTGQTVRFYIDGEPAGVVERFDGIPEFTREGLLYIGHGDPGHTNRYGFDGAIDELLIMTRAMTSAEMKEMYDGGKN